jgi:hypothetical protein
LTAPAHRRLARLGGIRDNAAVMSPHFFFELE